MNTMKCLNLLLFSFLFVFQGLSQSLTVDICPKFKDADTLQILITPSEDFDQIVSNIQFTLAWPGDSEVSLGELVSVDSAVVTFPIKMAGETHVTDSLHYQKFVGFGDKTLKTMGQKWEKGKSIVLFEIPVEYDGEGLPELTIGNDAQTNDTMFNGMYYFECNFRDVTGEIGACKDEAN